MKNSIRIAIIGDYDPNRLRQVAATTGLEHAAKKIGVPIDTTWISTSQLTTRAEELLTNRTFY